MGTAPSGKLTIREARPEEAEAVFTIGCLCFSDAWRKETVRKDMEGSHSLYLAAEEAGQILGYGCYWFVADEAQLVNIGVRPEARRRGIGEALLVCGLEAARKRQMASIYLEVRVSNLPAQALYRKYGFAVKALRRGVYDLPKEDGYIMARALPVPDREDL